MRRRADALLVARGIAGTRAQAQAAILAGRVRVDGRVVDKPSAMVAEEAAFEFEPAFPWASRAGLKLAHALDHFRLAVAGKTALDVGAATGGFTDVLLARGAARVYAVDVGRGQLAPRLAGDARVVAREALDARALTRAHIPTPPDIVVCDASFIGLEKILPAPLSLAAATADLVALVKPQFESGPRAKARIAPDEARRLADEVAGRLDGMEGFAMLGLVESPIEGGAGAVEFLLHAGRGWRG